MHLHSKRIQTELCKQACISKNSLEHACPAPRPSKRKLELALAGHKDASEEKKVGLPRPWLAPDGGFLAIIDPR